MINWIKNNRVEAIVIFLIILLAIFLRFYRLPEYMTFLGDEGRDALIIKKILVEHDFPLIGPPTSVGNMYLGPLYYYMMAIPMAIFWLNPVSAAMMVAVIGVLTVGLLYYLSKQWFGKWPATLAAFAYSISPVTIASSRSSWNPNPAPFFVLLAILGIYQIHRTKNFKWLILTGAAMAFLIQMHYLSVILLPVFIVFYLLELVFVHNDKNRKNLLLGTLAGLLIFLFLMSPLIIFDFRYNFMNYRALSAFFTQRETTVSLSPVNSVSKVVPIYEDKLVGRYISTENPLATPIISLIIFLPLLIMIKRLLSPKSLLTGLKTNWPYLILGVWLVGSMAGLSLYKQSIYDHYLGFVSPAAFLLLGGFVSLFKNSRQIIAVLILVGVLAFLNLQKSPLLLTPNNQLARTQEVTKFIISQAGDKPFNFALIANSNYDSAYQFYLDQYGHKPKVVPIEITDQLFVVCEDSVCKPIGHPKYEIAGFGWTTIEWEKEFDGVKIYKLIHNPLDPNFRK